MFYISAVNLTKGVNVNTANEAISTYKQAPKLQAMENTGPLHYLRIGLPQSLLTSKQLVELAGIIRRYSPRYALRLRSSTQLEIAMFSLQPPWPPDQSFQLTEQEINTRTHALPLAGRATLRVHVPAAQLRVRQLRVLAALMFTEGLPTVRVDDSETLAIENVWPGRAAVLRLGLREAGLVTV